MYTTLADIEALIENATPENFELDFKHGNALAKLDDDTKASIAKDCSAFANSGGGTLIYGIDERKQGAESIASGIAPVQNEKVSIDRLTQIIQFGVEPPLTKFKVISINVSGGTIFVVSIAPGDTAHQSKSDFKYYQRVVATNSPMLGFAIRDVMNRRSSPIVAVEMEVRPNFPQREEQRSIYVIPKLRNSGSLTAKHWVLEVLLPQNGAAQSAEHGVMVLQRAPDREYPDYSIFEFNSERGPLNRSMRLLPGQIIALDQTLGFSRLSVQITNDNLVIHRQKKPSLFWRLYVEDTPMALGEIEFSVWGTSLLTD